MQDNDDQNLSEKLQKLVETMDIANILTEPLTKSVENLLRFSAEEMNSDEASVLIRDGSEGDLKFLTAIGEVAGNLLDLKIPAGKGIAGFVISSGQPMAINDVGADQTFYDEVDRRTGYSTRTILATPLRHNGEVIGVLEYINRRGDPPFDGYTPEEMDRAAFFAEVIAPLVDAYESAQIMHEFGGRMLSTKNDQDYTEVRHWLGNLRGSAEHRDTMDLAVLLHELAARGEAEKQFCRDILEMVLRYSDSKTSTSFLSY